MHLAVLRPTVVRLRPASTPASRRSHHPKRSSSSLMTCNALRSLRQTLSPALAMFVVKRSDQFLNSCSVSTSHESGLPVFFPPKPTAFTSLYSAVWGIPNVAVHRQLLSRPFPNHCLIFLMSARNSFQVRQILFNRQKDLELRHHDGKTTRKDENRRQMSRRLFRLALEPKLCFTSAQCLTV